MTAHEMLKKFEEIIFHVEAWGITLTADEILEIDIKWEKVRQQALTDSAREKYDLTKKA